MNGGPLLVFAAVAALTTARPATTIPVAAVTPRGITVTLPQSILTSKEVTSHLTSGLTTAFVVLVSCEEKEGGARITVRHELWDETYLVTMLDSTAREQKLTFASAEKLKEWWGSAALLAMRAPARASRARVTVKVLPFSAKEQAETQKWLSKLFTSMTSVKDAPVDKRSDPGAAKILDVIVSTSIQRRPILEYQWTVDTKAEP